MRGDGRRPKDIRGIRILPHSLRYAEGSATIEVGETQIVCSATIEGKTPHETKISLNNHYNGEFVEPHGERTQRGYGIEVLERFVREEPA